MFKIDVEWEDNARVHDPLLRSTWARIAIHARVDRGSVCLSDCLHEKSRSRREAVYGSAFPLAAWLVENWWSLLHESTRINRFGGGRANEANPKLRPWIARHNLLAARNGFALPDLTLYRDGEKVVLLSVPDPWGQPSDYPIRFVAQYEFRLDPEDVAEGMRLFVENVAERVRESRANHLPEATEWLANWEAVQESSREERELCQTAARMGLDPYDPGELSEKIVDLIETSFPLLAPTLRLDLADVTTGASLSADLDWIGTVARQLGVGMTTADDRVSGDVTDGPAFLEGYRWASQLRANLALPDVVGDIGDLLRSRYGWESEPVVVDPTDGVADRINAIVGSSQGCVRIALPSPSARLATRRFLLARALFVTRESTRPHPRLLTSASSWWQRASRAFAAEFLAPASALAERVGSRVSTDRIETLADEFQVSQMVIEHQLVNHHLAEIVDL